MDEPMLTFLIRDDAEIVKQIDALAAQEGTSRAALYRRAVRMFLSGIELDEQRTKQEAAANDRE